MNVVAENSFNKFRLFSHHKSVVRIFELSADIFVPWWNSGCNLILKLQWSAYLSRKECDLVTNMYVIWDLRFFWLWIFILWSSQLCHYNQVNGNHCFEGTMPPCTLKMKALWSSETLITYQTKFYHTKKTVTLNALVCHRQWNYFVILYHILRNSSPKVLFYSA